eukprot:3429674-Pyramimonas_sp.AAC.1
MAEAPPLAQRRNRGRHRKEPAQQRKPSGPHAAPHQVPPRCARDPGCSRKAEGGKVAGPTAGGG